jgi:hypothetical protein
VNRRACVTIGFGGRQVVVESDEGPLLVAVRAPFRALEAPAPDPDAPHLLVSRRPDGYVVTGGREGISRLGSLEETLVSVRYEVVRQLIEARSDLLWLHAGAVARGGRALLIVGPGGVGKSTLATALLDRGFRYLGDDVAPIDLGTGRVVPFPTAPTVWRHPGRWVVPEAVTALPRADVRVTPRSVARAPVGVAALVFPRYVAAGPSAVERCAPGEAALTLLQQSLNFPSHRETAVRWACQLAAGRPAFRLAYADVGRAVELLTTSVGEPSPASRSGRATPASTGPGSRAGTPVPPLGQAVE